MLKSTQHKRSIKAKIIFQNLSLGSIDMEEVRLKIVLRIFLDIFLSCILTAPHWQKNKPCLLTADYAGAITLKYLINEHARFFNLKKNSTIY